MDALAHLQQKEHLIDRRVRPLHQDQLLLHSLHLTAVRDARSYAELLHGGVPSQTQHVLGEALAGAVLVVQRQQGFFEVGPQRPEHTGEHGSLQRQVWGWNEELIVLGNCSDSLMLSSEYFYTTVKLTAF